MTTGHHWTLSVFTMELRKIISYRMDFWINFLGSLLAQFGVAWFLWRAVFEQQHLTRVGEFGFTALMLYYLAVPLLNRAIQGGEMGNISAEIYDGSLNRYLVYPVSFFRYKLAVGAAHSLVFLIQLAVVLMLYLLLFDLPAEFSITPLSVACGLGSILMGAYLYFVLVAAIELAAFWADNVWSLVVIMRFLTGLLGGVMLPLSLFPESLQPLLNALPFAHFVWLPARTLFGLSSPQQWLASLPVLLLWSGLATLAYVALWRRGQYRYTGVGI